MKTRSLKQLSAVVLSFSVALALSGCGSGTGECSPLLGPCADGGQSATDAGGGGGGNNGGGGGGQDAGSAFTCSGLQNCYAGCENVPQAQQSGCVQTCQGQATPNALQLSAAMWTCIQNNCTPGGANPTNACIESACGSQLMACEADMSQASTGGGGGGFPSALVGEWDDGSVSTGGFYNASNGAWYDGSGTGMAYHFNADGTYSFAGLISAGGSCPLTDFVWTTGTATVQGNQLTLAQSTNVLRTTDYCGTDTTMPQGNSTGTVTWALDSTGKQLTITDSSSTTVYVKQG